MNAPLSELPTLTRQQKLFTLAGTLLSMFLSALDQTVVATAGPDIQRTLHLEPGLYAWITTAYLVSSTVLVPVYGRLSDLFGRKMILVVGVIIFLAASALCGISQNAAQLIAFRALQGVGSASIFTSAFAVVADLFTPAERGRFTGLFGAVFGVSSLVGPLLGGFITDQFGWHWVFFINLPLGAIALAFIILRMPPLKSTGPRASVDVMGAFLLAVGVIPLLIGASLGRAVLREGDTGYLWTSPPMLALGLVAVVGCVGFVAWELKVKDPLVDLSLFKIPAAKWGVLSMVVLGAAFLTPMVFLPLFMVNVVGVTATQSGLTISPLVMGIVAGNVLSGQLASRVGKYKPFMLIALVILTIGFLVMGFTLSATSTQREVTLKMIMLGLGLGPSIPLYTLAIQNAVPQRQMGVATSMTTFFRSMGSTIGVAIVGSIFATTLSDAMTRKLARATEGLPPALVQSFAKRSGGPGGSEGEARMMFDADAAKQRATDGLEGARRLALKALDGDALAVMAVKSSPLADEALKAAVAGGGPAAQAKARAAEQWLRVQEAAQDANRWTALLESKELPPVVRRAALDVSPSVLKDGAGPALALRPVKEVIDSEAERLGALALEQARTKVEMRLAVERPKVLAAIDAVGLAMKESFTESISAIYRLAAVLAVLAFLLTLKIPQLPLRGRFEPAPPAE